MRIPIDVNGCVLIDLPTQHLGDRRMDLTFLFLFLLFVLRILLSKHHI